MAERCELSITTGDSLSSMPKTLNTISYHCGVMTDKLFQITDYWYDAWKSNTKTYLDLFNK